MTVEWTEHRFSGGTLALDVTNTVVLRNDPTRTVDRFDDSAEIGRFAEAAGRYRRDELGGRLLTVEDGAAIRATVLEIREATDALFRGVAAGAGYAPPCLARFLRACAIGVEAGAVATPEAPFGSAGSPIAFEAALAVSALSLLHPATTGRLKICANCRWLFLDRSRNSSRMWCDMKVCGNRQKARRHYHRNRSANHGHDHA